MGPRQNLPAFSSYKHFVLISSLGAIMFFWEMNGPFGRFRQFDVDRPTSIIEPSY